MISLGDRVFWNTANGARNGIVMRELEDGHFVVAMGSGKCVVLGKGSILEVENDEG